MLRPLLDSLAISVVRDTVMTGSPFKVAGLVMALLIGATTLMAHAPQGRFEYDYDSGWPITCADSGGKLDFTVAFAAHHENVVQIQRAHTGEVVRSFNNYYGRGGGASQGPGTWRTPVAPSQPECYLLVAQHKRTPPNANEGWMASHFVIRNHGQEVGFADWVDRSYVTVIVTVVQVP